MCVGGGAIGCDHGQAHVGRVPQTPPALLPVSAPSFPRFTHTRIPPMISIALFLLYHVSCILTPTPLLHLLPPSLAPPVVCTWLKLANIPRAVSSSGAAVQQGAGASAAGGPVRLLLLPVGRVSLLLVGGVCSSPARPLFAVMLIPQLVSNTNDASLAVEFHLLLVVG